MEKVKLYKAISGKKSYIIGEGASLIEAIKEAVILGHIRLFEETSDMSNRELENYILSATQDYVIER